MSSEPASEPQNAPLYLYLTTTGRKTGNPHEIEIWFVEYGARYYMMTEFPDRSDWFKNILHNPSVIFRVGSRSAEPTGGTARVIDHAQAPDLTAAVARLMDEKYNWSDGQIVELRKS
jgi:deazaflavin-dependent oxidoreductase (nitroreductase family)